MKLEFGIAIMLMMIFVAQGMTDVQRCLHACKLQCGNDKKCYNGCVNNCVVSMNVQSQIHYCKIGCFSSRCSKFDVNDKKREICLDDCFNKVCYFKN